MFKYLHFQDEKYVLDHCTKITALPFFMNLKLLKYTQPKPSLRELKCFNLLCSIDQIVQKFPNLTEIFAYGFRDNITTICCAFPALTHFTLQQVVLRDLKAICSLRHLRSLSIMYHRCDSHLVQITQQLRNLEYLKIWNSGCLGSNVMRYISRMPHLKCLVLCHPTTNDDGYKHIRFYTDSKNFPELTNFRLIGLSQTQFNHAVKAVLSKYRPEINVTGSSRQNYRYEID